MVLLLSIQQFEQFNVLGKTIISPAHWIKRSNGMPRNGCSCWNEEYFLPSFYNFVGIDLWVLEKIFVEIYKCICTIFLSSLQGWIPSYWQIFYNNPWESELLFLAVIKQFFLPVFKKNSCYVPVLSSLPDSSCNNCFQNSYLSCYLK